MPSPSLSVIIIAKNEAHNIQRCLRSVQWADEIIVLDSGSTDNTVEISRLYTSKVYSTDWPGYGPQKNRALALVEGDWVLSLDADEWLSHGLRDEIQSAILSTQFQAYYLRRLTMYCGRFQRYGDAAKDKVLRLFQRKSGKFTNDMVHEKVLSEGRVGLLQKPLLHNAYRNLTEWSHQMHHYAILTAELRYTKGRRSHPIKACVHCAWAFFRSYFLRRGYKDGRLGFIFAKLSAKSSYQRNMLLWHASKREM